MQKFKHSKKCNNLNTLLHGSVLFSSVNAALLITRRCQSNGIERKFQSNQSNTFKCNRMIAIQLSNTIEYQLNLKFWVKFDLFD